MGKGTWSRIKEPATLREVQTWRARRGEGGKEHSLHPRCGAPLKGEAGTSPYCKGHFGHRAEEAQEGTKFYKQGEQWEDLTMPVAVTWAESARWPQKGWMGAHGGAGLGCVICSRNAGEIPQVLSFLTVLLGNLGKLKISDMAPGGSQQPPVPSRYRTHVS